MDLRSILGQIPCVALTATATEKTLSVIQEDLAMHNCKKVILSPHKKNIKYSVVEISHAKDYEKNFTWLVNLIKDKQQDTAKFLIFFKKMTYLTEVYEYLNSELKGDGYVNYDPKGTNDDRNHLFEMYHMKVQEEVKENIVNTFMDPNGHIRVVLCSSSFSMGLNLRDVDLVIHYGVPSDLDDYLQQTGRAGRDSSHQAHAIVLRHKQCLLGKNIKPEMKLVVKTRGCRRVALYQSYVPGIEPLETRHNCCDNCAHMCDCQPNCDGMTPPIVAQILLNLQHKESDDSTDENNEYDDIVMSESDDEIIELYRRAKPSAIIYTGDSDSD